MSVQFYGYNFGGTSVFHFSAFMHSFQKLVSDFGDFEPYVLEETAIEKALHANQCVRCIEAFIANLGHPVWGSQSMQDLASLMRKGEHSSFQVLIPALTASPMKDDPDLQWMPLFISPGMIFCRFKSEFHFFFSNPYTFCYFLVLEAP